MKNCNAELTKVKTIETWNNSTCSGSRFIIYGRLHNAENTYYKPFHCVYFIDYDFNDLADFAGVESFKSKKQFETAQKQYIAENFYNIVDYYVIDFENCDALIDYCNSTIHEYNNSRRNRF